MLNEVLLCGTNTNPLPQVCKGLSGVKILKCLLTKCPLNAQVPMPKCRSVLYVSKCRSTLSAEVPSSEVLQAPQAPKTVKLSSASNYHKCLIAFF